MPKQVVAGALLKCSKGTAPSVLAVLPLARVTVEERAAATVRDFLPLVNIKPFLLCRSRMNPAVAAASAANAGVLTPMPCLPLALKPWSSGASSVRIGGAAALDNRSKCKCAWRGSITVKCAGTTRTVVP